MVIFSTGLFLRLPHSSLSLSCAPCPVPCIISWPHPVHLGPIMHRCYKHYFHCTVSLIWLFYHFKINFWGDKVYYTELCTGIQQFILLYSTLDFQCTLHWKNQKSTADIKCDVHWIQVWFTLWISEWYQCDSHGDPVHITLDCTVCITLDLCVRIFCSDGHGWGVVLIICIF